MNGEEKRVGPLAVGQGETDRRLEGVHREGREGGQDELEG